MLSTIVTCTGHLEVDNFGILQSELSHNEKPFPKELPCEQEHKEMLLQRTKTMCTCGETGRRASYHQIQSRLFRSHFVQVKMRMPRISWQLPHLKKKCFLWKNKKYYKLQHVPRPFNYKAKENTWLIFPLAILLPIVFPTCLINAPTLFF